MAQLLSYMKLLDVPLDLLINFHEMIATDGISRLILPGANLSKPAKGIQQEQMEALKKSGREGDTDFKLLARDTTNLSRRDISATNALCP